jgi:hypothetical protein
MTLNELQTLLGNINWIWPFLKIPSDSLKPVFELLKGDSQLNSLRKLTPEAQAIQLVETTLQHSVINRIDPSQPLQLLIWGTPTTPTGATIQWPNKMIEMLFTHNTPPKTITPYVQEVIYLIMKGRQRCKQLSGKDPSLIITPFTNIQIDYLYQQNYLWQIAISNYSGQFDNHYPKDPTIKFLTSQAWILPLITATKSLPNIITVYTDGTSKGRAGYIIYSHLGTCTEQINIATPGATAQHAEILVVLVAL